jgi:hypothetical protein
MISDKVYKKLFREGKLPPTANIDQKMDFCAMAARFLRSAILACSIKEGKDGQINMGFADETEKPWNPINIISS